MNDKQKNTLFVSFFTLDFMIAGFLALVYFVVPQVGKTWWASNERPLLMFGSCIILWGAYALTVFISLRRQA